MSSKYDRAKDTAAMVHELNAIQTTFLQQINSITTPAEVDEKLWPLLRGLLPQTEASIENAFARKAISESTRNELLLSYTEFLIGFCGDRHDQIKKPNSSSE